MATCGPPATGQWRCCSEHELPPRRSSGAGSAGGLDGGADGDAGPRPPRCCRRGCGCCGGAGAAAIGRAACCAVRERCCGRGCGCACGVGADADAAQAAAGDAGEPPGPAPAVDGSAPSPAAPPPHRDPGGHAPAPPPPPRAGPVPAAEGAGAGAAGAAPAGLAALPREVLTAIAARLADPEDRAALAAACSATRAAAAAAALSLRLPPGALLAAAAGGQLRHALARHAGAARLSFGGGPPAPPLQPLQLQLPQPRYRRSHAAAAAVAVVPALLRALPALRRLSRLDLTGVPPAAYEASPCRLLSGLVAACPQLQELDLSASLWHGPAQAATLRAMARRGGVLAPRPPPPAAAPALPVRWEAEAVANAAAAAQHRHRLQVASALLSKALATQAAREDLRCLSGLARLASLSIAHGLPPEVLPQLPGLPDSLSRLSLDCGLLYDDARLGGALGALTGLTSLELTGVPSLEGELFTHMAGLTNLRQLDLLRCLLGPGGLAPLATALPGLESLQVCGCPNMHSLCRAQLPEELTRLGQLSTLYLDFMLHVRDTQVLVQLPSLTALAASQLHACVSTHFAGRGFPRVRRLALHTLEPDGCTCLAAPHPPPDGAGAAAVRRVGLLVALCPCLEHLSLGRGSAAALFAIQTHASLTTLVIHGPPPPPPPPAGAALAAAAEPLHAAAPAGWPVAAGGGSWLGLMRRHALPRLARLSFLDADSVLQRSPSPAMLLLALSTHSNGAAGGGSCDELRLMRYSSVTDRGLALASNLMGGLRSLALDGCRNITDAGLFSLAAAPALEDLSLSGFARITDAGVAALLAAAPRLRRLRVAGCGATTAEGCLAAGAAAYRTRGRRVRVDWARS
ncbi:hypothetical protein Rsub_08758 [Raphidocelis subcapitata]|uniref:F-box/LRR-repeat protein 15-like leucin rich repeat domain-containing protein n=1 Tax=Raphidocelis subcapitata TaxID=307507 RepID=A0A2V0PE90_9CHLO|nr:hypothetical protein Rsub_08758 [Raphidocelis subcapitata]|eukprot:GBF96213.1 hypothetical protein Rsub_08758 [Raphidocelis subcapitata]